MATSYPTSIDVYTNPAYFNPGPTFTGTGEHSNAYDAIIAIETFIGTSAAPVPHNPSYATAATGATALIGSPLTILTLASLPAGTYLMTATVNITNQATLTVVEPVGVLLGPTTNSSGGAYITTWQTLPVTTGAGASIISVTVIDIVVLASTTTVYCEAICLNGTGAAALSSQGQWFNAVRIN